MEQLARLVDGWLDEPALVSGSLPPLGRDLDLVVRPAQERSLAERLRAADFLEHAGEWVRFHGRTADALDLIPVADWELPGDESDALFRDARPIDGYARLTRPAPPHLLLMVARRLAEGDGRLDEKRRTRVAAALAEDAGAWDAAAGRAARWGMRRGLAGLRAAYERGERMSARARAEATAERLVALGMDARRARAEGWRRALRPAARPGGFLVAFSGLDGAGKSSKAEALREALERLGYDVRLEWTRLEWTTLWETGSALGKVAWPVTAALALAERVRASQPDQVRGHVPGPGPVQWYTDKPETAASRFRRRVPLVNDAWVTVVALAHARAQRRATAPHIRAGRAVVCDRYTLDAAVYLRFRYGEERRFAHAVRLLERLSPRPLRAFLVDVPADVAYRRKAEQYDLRELERQARLYREEAQRLGVTVVDGERPREELCAEICEAVWRALRG